VRCGWKWVHASAAGSAHQQEGSGCQDFSLGSEGEDGNNPPVLAFAVADGAGSARHAGLASAIVCDVFVTSVTLMASVAGWRPEHASHDWAVSMLEKLVGALKGRAEMRAAELSDFATTFLGAAISDSGACFFQVGDGAIVALKEGAYEPVFWPQEGEYVNTTTFVTSPEAAGSLLFVHRPGQLDGVALLTDGLQRLALDYRRKSVHAPFFVPMFERLRQEPPGNARSLGKELIRFLESPAIRERTDDDATLLLATSLQGPIPPAS
jgi:hypothetical protein